MDTSEAYIKMWLASGLEIEPDVMFQPYVCPACHNVTDDSTCRCVGSQLPSQVLKVTITKPLPRQDQLQGMLIGHGHQNSGILFILSRFADEYGYNDVPMEQLWLAFVMHELHNEVWDRKK